MEEKKMQLGFSFSLLVLFIVMITGACSGPTMNTQGSSKVLYLKNNIHVQHHENTGEYRASYANWTDPGIGHIVIPVNTKVSVGRFQRGFLLRIQGTGQGILFEFNRRAGVSLEHYLGLITSPEPVRLDGFSELDRKGIQEGKAYLGMTKEGIRIALGYPAPHMTPSLEKDTWYYWTNRFKSIAIEFDHDGKMKNIGK